MVFNNMKRQDLREIIYTGKTNIDEAEMDQSNLSKN